MCTLCQAMFVTDEYEFHDDLANSQALFETVDAAGNTSTIYSMTASDTFSGSISSTTDTDWIEISIPAGEQWEIGLTGTSGTTDPIVSLYDSGGNFLLTEQAYDGFTSSLSYTNTSGTAQTFYIQSADYLSNGTGDYTISISASTPAPLTEWTDQEIAEQLKNGYWSQFGFNNVAWDVSPGDTIVVDITRLTADGQFLATKSLEAWTFMTGINFSIITDPAQALTENGSGYDANGTPANPGGIIFDDDESGAFANFQFSGSHTTGEGGTAGTIYNAKINVSTGWLDIYGTELDTYSFQTYIHEIGHALGLGHGGDYNGSASYPADAKYLNDNWQKTVMSYFSQTENTDPSADGSFAYIVTPMVADIIAVQELYGVAGDLRTGDTTYGYNSNAGGYYDDLVNLTDPSGISFTILDDGGIDTLDLSGMTMALRVDLNDGAYSDVAGEIENLFIYDGTMIENFIGGSAADSITGNEGDNSLDGGAGNDVIDGGDGNDVIDGGDGNDTIDGGAGDDQIFGNGGVIDAGIGNDFVTASAASNETYYGGDGVDILDLRGFNGDYVLDLAAGTTNYGETFAEFESVLLGNGTNTVTGTSGTNEFLGGTASDYMDGAAGADVLNGAEGNDTLIGDTGADEILGGADSDHLYGGGGSDVMEGESGSDTLFGGTGSDLLWGGDGDDYLNGEGGSDVIDGGDGNDSIIGEIGFNTISGGLGDDTIDSGVQDDAVDGGAGNDTIMGNSGNDVLRGGADADSVNGGAGTDTIHGDAGVDILFGSNGDDFVYGGTEGDTLGGNGGEDTLFGGSGADSLDGGANDDSLSGGDGADSLFGAGGNDILDGDAQADTIDGGAGADTIHGGDGDDLLIGNGRSDVIFGDDGNDFIRADGAIDTAYGGIGDDEIYGGAQRDTLFGGADDDTITGEFGNDSLFGGIGADTLVGDGGDDDLDGGAGNDTLTGGSGGDDFIFLDTGSGTGADLITDFQNAVDTLQFDDALWTGTLTAQQIVADFATETGTAVVFDFGSGNIVTVDGITDADSLTDNIVII